MYLLQIFSLNLWQKFLILMKSSLSIISFMDYTFGVYLRNYCHTQGSPRFSPMLYSRSFIFMSIINFELIVMKEVRSVSRFCCCCCFVFWRWMSICSSTICEKTVFAPLYRLYFFVKDQLTVFMWAYFWSLCSVPLIYLPVPHCLDDCGFIESLEVG